MKVLHLLQSNSFSGAENVVCQIIKLFENTNVEMVYCSPDGSINDKLLELGIRHISISKISKKNLKKIILDEKPNIIHAHDFTASFIASLFSKKISVISHIHCNPLWMQKKNLKSFLFKFTCKNVSKVLGVSRSVYDDYIYKDTLKDKFIDISNPFSTQLIETRAYEYEYDGNFDVCFFGRLSQEKGPLKFINIIEKIKEKKKNVSAIFIGDGELREELKTVVSEKRLDSNIVFNGFSKNPFPIVKKCRVICNTSIYEGFGLAVLESMTLGLPAVCSNVGGLKYIVNSTNGLLCDNDDQFIDEITRLLNDDNYYQLKSNGARNTASEFDNYDEYKLKLEKCYNEIK